MMSVTTSVLLLTPTSRFWRIFGDIWDIWTFITFLSGSLWIYPGLRLYIDFIVSWYALEKLFGV